MSDIDLVIVDTKFAIPNNSNDNNLNKTLNNLVLSCVSGGRSTDTSCKFKSPNIPSDQNLKQEQFNK